VVVDFSKATKREIIAHIKKEGKICGRIPRAFLDTNLVDESERQAFGLKGLVATVVNLLALTTTVQAQVKEEPKQEVGAVLENKSSTMDEQHPVIQDVDRGNIKTIKGRVLSASDNLPLPGASISIMGSQEGVLADLEGKFEITVPLDTTNELWIDFIGFETKKIRVRLASSNYIKVSLKEQTEQLSTGLIIVTKKKKRFWLF
jgi:hypothetical protein